MYDLQPRCLQSIDLKLHLNPLACGNLLVVVYERCGGALVRGQ